MSFKERLQAEWDKAKAEMSGGTVGNIVLIVLVVLVVVFILYLAGVLEVSPIGS